MAAWNPADSDDEVENESEFQSRNRCAELCIIDVTSNMFRPCFEETNPVTAALKVFLLLLDFH